MVDFSVGPSTVAIAATPTRVYTLERPSTEAIRVRSFDHAGREQTSETINDNIRERDFSYVQPFATSIAANGTHVFVGVRWLRSIRGRSVNQGAIYQYTNAGRLVRKREANIPSAGDAPWPSAMAVDDRNRVRALDGRRSRIRLLDTRFNEVLSLAEELRPDDLAMAGPRMYALYRSTIRSFTQQGVRVPQEDFTVSILFPQSIAAIVGLPGAHLFIFRGGTVFRRSTSLIFSSGDPSLSVFVEGTAEIPPPVFSAGEPLLRAVPSGHKALFSAGRPSLSVLAVSHAMATLHAGVPSFSAIVNTIQGNFSAAATQRPEGVAVADGLAYIVDTRLFQVVVYSLLGAPQTTRGFNLHNDNTAPRGIAVVGGFAYVVDANQDRVFCYEVRNGGYRSDLSWALVAGPNRNPSGITFFEGEFYVFDLGNRSVYVHGSTGTFQRLISLSDAPQGAVYQGIGINVDGMWLVNSALRRIERFSSEGVFQTEGLSTVELQMENVAPAGMDISAFRAFIIDQDDQRIYVYNLRPDPTPPVVDIHQDIEFAAGRPTLNVGAAAIPTPGSRTGEWLPWGHTGLAENSAITGLTPGGRYDIRVRPIRDGSEEDAEWVEALGLETKPPHSHLKRRGQPILAGGSKRGRQHRVSWGDPNAAGQGWAGPHGPASRGSGRAGPPALFWCSPAQGEDHRNDDDLGTALRAQGQTQWLSGAASHRARTRPIIRPVQPRITGTDAGSRWAQPYTRQGRMQIPLGTAPRARGSPFRRHARQFGSRHSPAGGGD